MNVLGYCLGETKVIHLLLRSQVSFNKLVVLLEVLIELKPGINTKAFMNQILVLTWKLDNYPRKFPEEMIII